MKIPRNIGSFRIFGKMLTIDAYMLSLTWMFARSGRICFGQKKNITVNKFASQLSNRERVLGLCGCLLLVLSKAVMVSWLLLVAYFLFLKALLFLPYFFFFLFSRCVKQEPKNNNKNNECSHCRLMLQQRSKWKVYSTKQKSAWQQSSSQFTILKILHKCFNVRCESSIF